MIMAIKIGCMITMFLVIIISGNIPIRHKAFKENQQLLSLTAGFSGGLFLSVGMIHLLPESILFIQKYLQLRGIEPDKQFPWACLIVVLSFTIILYIERIQFDHKHKHQQLNEEQSSTEIPSPNKQKVLKEQQSPLTPFILQIAIGKYKFILGIHAVFEGLAIGIVQEVPECIGISLAVVCHKWAEGITLGLAFRQANIDIKIATIMITIQAVMNPIGILFGWLLSNQGLLMTGIFQSISAGTFIYIATMEVINEEFGSQRYKFQKLFMFMLATLFVSLIWILEQSI
ncbi:hypothetical protein pb186bvf_006200 [Paramecium bursaria]